MVRFHMNTVVIKYHHIVDLLEDLVQADPSNPTDLIICSSRIDFLDQITPALHGHSADTPTGLENDEDHHEASITSAHAFLVPTLGLLNTSQHVKLVFCPTISALRGYLAGYVGSASLPSTSGASQLVVLNNLALHHKSSEFTVQGLSQTFAAIVSAGTRSRRRVRLVECKDVHESSGDDHGSDLWNKQVPLLSTSVKIGEQAARWGRRTFRVSRIASRWFKFEAST